MKKFMITCIAIVILFAVGYYEYQQNPAFQSWVDEKAGNAKLNTSERVEQVKKQTEQITKGEVVKNPDRKEAEAFFERYFDATFELRKDGKYHPIRNMGEKGYAMLINGFVKEEVMDGWNTIFDLDKPFAFSTDQPFRCESIHTFYNKKDGSFSYAVCAKKFITDQTYQLYVFVTRVNNRLVIFETASNELDVKYDIVKKDVVEK